MLRYKKAVNFLTASHIMIITFLFHRYNMTLTHCPRSLSDLKGNGDFSNIHKPLLNLDLDHIIPDELHLMLRVTDRLITALIQTAKSYDQHQHRLERIRRAYKVLDGERIKNLIAAIRECGVYFNIYEDDESGKVEWPSLLGPDKLKLLKNLPDKLVGCQPPEMVPLTQNLWKVWCILSIFNTYAITMLGL